MQRVGLAAELAGGGLHVVGQRPRLVGGLAGAGDVDRDLAGAGGRLLHAARNLAGCRILLFDGCGNRGGDAADLADGVADAADRGDAAAGRGLDRGDLFGDFLRCLRGLAGEVLDLGGDDGKTSAGIAGARGLDGRI